MILLFVFSTLLGIGTAQYGQQTNHNHYDRRQQDTFLERVNVLNSLTTTRESVDSLHFSRVAELRASANNNLDLANNVNAFVIVSIDQDQYRQDHRLNALAARLNEIQALRRQVAGLTETADELVGVVAEERRANKQFQFDINCLQHNDTARFNRIESTQQRADAANSRIDLLPVINWEDTRSLDIEETSTRNVFDAMLRQRHSGSGANLQPNNSTASTAVVNFDPSFVGAPNFNLASPIGFRFIEPHSYGRRGYPAIYFNVEEELWNTRSELRAVEMSSGRWHVDHINVDVDNIYIDDTVFSKSDLDGISSNFRIRLP